MGLSFTTILSPLSSNTDQQYQCPALHLLLKDIYGFKKVGLQTEVLIFDKNTGLGLDGVEITSECLSSQTTYTTNVDGRLYIPLPPWSAIVN